MELFLVLATILNIFTASMLPAAAISKENNGASVTSIGRSLDLDTAGSSFCCGFGYPGFYGYHPGYHYPRPFGGYGGYGYYGLGYRFGLGLPYYGR